MFLFNIKPTFVMTARLRLPGDMEAIAVELTCRYKTPAQVAALSQEAAGKDADGDLWFVLQVVEDWSGFLGEDRVPVKFGREALAELQTQVWGALGGIVTAYVNELAGVKLGN